MKQGQDIFPMQKIVKQNLLVSGIVHDTKKIALLWVGR